MGRSYSSARTTSLEGTEALDRITPPVLTASVNDYAPDGYTYTSCYNLVASAAVNITGMAGGSDERRLTLVNQGGQTITLKNASVASVPANRFAFSSDLLLIANSVVDLQYSAEVGAWLLVGTSGSGGGGGPSLVGNNVWTGSNEFDGALIENGVTSVVLPLGTTNDQALAATTNHLRLTGNAGGSNLTGLVFSANGRKVRIHNIAATDIVLSHATGSAAANQFLCPGSGDLTLIVNSSVDAWYDAANTKWRIS